MGPGNQTPVLWKSSRCSLSTEPSLQPSPTSSLNRAPLLHSDPALTPPFLLSAAVLSALVNPDMPVFGSSLPAFRCRRPSHHTCSFPATEPAGSLSYHHPRHRFLSSARNEPFSLSHLSDPHLTLETHCLRHLLQETFLVPITSG